MKSLVTLLFILALLPAKANDTIVVRKDPRMDALSIVQKQFNQRMSLMLSNGLYRGFRIQAISTPQRDNAFAVKADLERQFPEHKTYIIFQSPNFKVRIGNFIRRDEADKFKAQLNKLFPNGVYIVNDAVEYVEKAEADTTSQQQ